MDKKIVTIDDGNGGEEMQEFLNFFLDGIFRGDKDSLWKGFDDDSSFFDLGDGRKLFFTTDSFVVEPIFFPGGDIGHLSVCGTINDLVVMGAKPVGLSLGMVIEEGFSLDDLEKIRDSIYSVCKRYNVPVVCGDTKVMERGSIDKIVINVSGVGIFNGVISREISEGYDVIVSGGIGEHGIALLSKRFDFETEIVSDSKPLIDEMYDIRELVCFARDPTRGGLAMVLNDIAKKSGMCVEVNEKDIPIKKEVKKACELLGVDPYSLANEGRVVVVCDKKNSLEVVSRLKKYNDMAQIIGTIKKNGDYTDGKVILNTDVGKRIVSVPSGRIVPRIC